MHIRVAKTGDASQACEVLRRSIIECCATDHRVDTVVLQRWLRDKTPATVAEWFAWPTHYPVVALLDGSIAGVAMLSGVRKIVLFHVDPDYRRRGVGTALLHALEEKTMRSGGSLIRIASTPSARPFYEHCGFYVVGTRSVVFGTAWKMRKDLCAGRGGGAKAGGRATTRIQTS